MKHTILTAFAALLFSTCFCQTTGPKTNESDIVFTKTEIEASFPGGDSAWTEYIKGVIIKNIKKLTKEGISGTCRVRFIVNKDGTITDVMALTMRGSLLAALVKDAIISGPKWIPAQQNERYVKAFREQPVSFKIQEQ